MDVIKTYLDNVFTAFPQTTQIQILKRDMLANMEEKYAALRQSGKSEHEAAYSVIADFGNIEEIRAELELDMTAGESDTNISMSDDEVQVYLSNSEKSGVLVGLGVWLIIAGVSSVIILDNALVMFLAIAVAVTIFIMNGNRMGAYEAFDKTPILLSTHSHDMLEVRRARFMPRCNAIVAAGIVLILLSVGGFTVIDFPVPLFLNIVGFSVFLFIVAGSRSSAYDILLGRGDYANKTLNKQIGRITAAVASVYWPVVTVVFLSWSFLRNAWGISWVIWPIAGGLFGAIAAGISVWFGTKEKNRGQ